MMNISGWWTNKKTQKSVNVRDMISEDSKMFVTTYDGRYIALDEFQDDYYQSSEPKNNPKEIFVEASPSVLIGDVPSETEFDYLNYVAPNTPIVECKSVEVSKPKSVSFDVIDKAFKKDGFTKPELVVTIKWKKPEKVIDFLVEYLDITKEEINDYLMENMFDDKFIKDAISEKLKTILG